MNDWAVYRIDYHSNEFVVAKGLSKDEADRIAADYIQRGHHQHYWVDKQPSDEFDAEDALQKMLRSGSTTELSISVLLSQGISIDRCIDALDKCSTMDSSECRTVVRNVEARQSGSGG